MCGTCPGDSELRCSKRVNHVYLSTKQRVICSEDGEGEVHSKVRCEIGSVLIPRLCSAWSWPIGSRPGKAVPGSQYVAGSCCSESACLLFADDSTPINEAIGYFMLPQGRVRRRASAR